MPTPCLHIPEQELLVLAGGLLSTARWLAFCATQTLVELEAAFAQAEQSTRQLDGQLEERRRQTQALVLQAQLQEVQQVENKAVHQ